MTTTTRIQPSPVNQSKFSPTKFMLYGFLFIFLGYFLLPLIWLLISSTKSVNGLFNTFGFWFDKENYLASNLKSLFTYGNGVYILWMKNTAIYAISAAFGSSIISAMAGYAFSQYQFAGRDKLFAIVLGSVFIPVTVFAVPLFLLIAKTGLSGSLWGIILPSLASPFGVYLMRIYADQAIPPEIIDAARIDGAGEVRIFFEIVFRLLAPGYATVLLFAFVGAWNNYFLPLLVLTKAEVYPLTVGLDYWNALTQGQATGSSLFPIILTGSVVGTIPVMVAFLILQRYWQGGLAFGSVK